MDSRQTKWVATVTGSGMGTFHVEAAARDALETELGDLMDMHLGRVRWTVDERPADWSCDGRDGCSVADEPSSTATPVVDQPARTATPSADQLRLDL